MWGGYGLQYASDRSDRSERDARKAGLVAKWKEQSGQIKSTGNAAYLLLQTRRNHAIMEDEEPIVIGLYDSKAAAVAAASTVRCDYGTFDEAMKDPFGEGGYEDNREDPPDDGILIQVGRDDIGEGDYCCLSIKKLPILGIQEAEAKKDEERKEEADMKKGAKTKDSGTTKRKYSCSSNSSDESAVEKVVFL